MAILLALLNHAKKFLDGDKDYAEKVEVVETNNLEAARRQLAWIGKDLTDPQSVYALHTLDSEKYVYEKTREVVYCFERVNKCRRGIRRVRLACEFTKWSSILGVVFVVFFAGALWGRMPDVMIRIIAIVGGAAVGIAVLSFVYAEGWFQVIRSQHDRSKALG